MEGACGALVQDDWPGGVDMYSLFIDEELLAETLSHSGVNGESMLPGEARQDGNTLATGRASVMGGDLRAQRMQDGLPEMEQAPPVHPGLTTMSSCGSILHSPF